VAWFEFFKANFMGIQVDAELIQDASRFKMDLLGGLERTLHGKIKPSKYYIAEKQHGSGR
jgi:hypothetical protein